MKVTIPSRNNPNIETLPGSVLGKMKNIIHKKLDGALIEKAKGMGTEGPEKISIEYDPFYTDRGGPWRRKPSRVNYQLLSSIAKSSTIISCIIITRTNQVAAFSERQKDKYSLDYILEPVDPDLEIGDEQKAELEKYYAYIENLGDPELKPNDEDISFDEFLRRIAWDRLVYDQVAVERVRSRDESELVYFTPVDGSTIRYTSAYDTSTVDLYQTKKEDKINQNHNLKVHDPKDRDLQDSDYKYIQIIDENQYGVFTNDDLILRMSNKTNGVKMNGYSISEIEMLLTTITSHMNAETHNKKLFTQGHIDKGILHFKANISQRKLNMFKKAWYAQTAGVSNSWRTPIIAGMDDVKYISLQNQKDGTFQLWIEYCIKLICAIYLMDPSEINFDISQGSEGGNPMFTSKNEHKVKQSRDRGLRPLLRFIESIINEIMEDVTDGKYRFRFVGLDVESKTDELERQKTEIETSKSINEIRQENGLEAIDLSFDVGGKIIKPYDLPANQQMTTLINQILQMTAQPEGGEEGGFGEEPEIDDEDIDGTNADIDEEMEMSQASKLKVEYYTLEKSKDQIKGGKADKKTPKQFDSKKLAIGTKVEMEHTDDPKKAREIAMDHLTENSKYYDDGGKEAGKDLAADIKEAKEEIK